MEQEMIEYKEGYKKQLTKPHRYNLGVSVAAFIFPLDEGKDYRGCSPFLRIYPNGDIVQAEGYAWDGASGPAIDDKTNHVPALEHDGEYQLMRNNILPRDPFRKICDKKLIKGCKARGMNWFRAKYWYFFLRWKGRKSATDKKKIQRAK